MGAANGGMGTKGPDVTTVKLPGASQYFTSSVPGFLAVCLLFLIITGLFTCPLVFNLGSRLIGTTTSLNEDTIIPVWYWWYLRENLASIPSNPGLLFRTTMLYAPYGQDVQTHISNLFFVIGMFPVIGVWGYPYNANLLVLAALCLNGILLFHVLRKMGLDRISSVLGGALVTLNPYYIHTAAAGKQEQAVVWGLVLAMAALPVCLSRGGKKRTLFTAVLFLLASIVYWFHGLFLGFFLMLATGMAVIRAPSKYRWRPVTRALTVSVLFLALSMPFLLPFLPLGRTEGKVMGVTSKTVVPLTFPPRSGGRPSMLETEADQLRIRSDSPASLRKNPVALLTLSLCIPLLFFKKRPWLWIITAGTFYVLSLGPYLTVPGLEKQIVLPFSLLYATVPFFSRILSTDRFLAVTYLAMSIMAACSFARCSRRFRFSVRTRLALVLVLVLIAGASGRWQMSRNVKLNALLEVPEGMARIKGLPGGVIDVPFFTETVCTRALRYQMVHGCPLLAGPGANVRYASPGSFKQMVARYPLLQYLSGFGHDGGARIRGESIDLNLFKKMGFRFVIQHKNPEGEEQGRDAQALSSGESSGTASLSEILGVFPIYRDQRVDIYDLKHVCRPASTGRSASSCCCTCHTCGWPFRKCPGAGRD